MRHAADDNKDFCNNPANFSAITTAVRFLKITKPFVEYRNNQYGFSLQLPPSWKGYTVTTSTGSVGEVFDGSGSYPESKEMAVYVALHHTKSSSEPDWQALPINIYTLHQWQMIQDGEIHAGGAAPVEPSEIGRNSKYVFATPARWVGFYDSLAQDEAQDILAAIKTF